jgi:DNA/RNA-binding domain of Phe-tRNA-synthetase-like protein
MTNQEPFHLNVAPHPLLRPAAFTTTFPKPLGELPTPPSVMDLLTMEAQGPIARSEEIRMAVRNLLRHWGHKPAGRGKPASEYLIRAVDRGDLGSINLAVDICNVISFHSGFSIALVDLDVADPPFRVDRGAEGASYIFNQSDQEMSLEGLICLSDASGPCGNPVKDSQRTKTHPGSTRTLTVIWGATGFPDQLAGAVQWYRELLEESGGMVEEVPVNLEGPEG